MVETPGEDKSASSAWSEVLDGIDVKHDKAHERLRNDLERTAELLRGLTTRVESNYNYFVLQQGALQRDIDEAKMLAKRPVDGMAMVWNTRTVLGLIGAVVVGVGMYWDLRQGNKDTRREVAEARAEQSKAIAQVQRQREDDKREAMERLTQFLQQQLNTSTQVAAAAAKGAKK